MKVKFIDCKYGPKKKTVINNPKKQEFYRQLAKFNPGYVVIYE